MSTSLAGRDLLTLADLAPEEVALVIDTALEEKAAWKAGVRASPLAGCAVALVFEKPSMRTRVSFEVACARLGAAPIILSGADSAFSRGESVADTARVLERYCDAIVLRTFAHARIEEVARWARVPVVNSLSDDHHPCQGLADILTIHEHIGRLDRVVFAYVGDGNNMAHTYLHAGALTGMQVRVATPVGFEPRPEIVLKARAIAATTGASIEVGVDPEAAVQGADVIATDTWTSMGQEDERAQRVAAFKPYRVDASLMALAAPNARFMHCLPAHRGEEVTDEVIDGPSSVVFDEAENRVHVQLALLKLLLS